MDSLSFNKTNSVDVKDRQVSFTGQKSVIEASGARIYRFFAPPYDETKDGKQYTLALELVPVTEEKDKSGKPTGKLVENGVPILLPRSVDSLKYGSFDMDTRDVMLPETDIVGYRFVLLDKAKLAQTKSVDLARTDKYLLDSGAVLEGGDGKFSYFSKKQGFVNKKGPMYHIFPDSYNVKGNEDFVRNHFNKAGGTIQGMIEKLKAPDSELAAYEMIISTPLFGADDISSHGYWTMNPYQITSTKGNLEDFKDLQNAMFDTGKTYVADGAFTSLSFESPQLQHFFKWGKESPTYNWIKFDKTDAPNGKVPIGIFPDEIVADTNNASSADYKKAKLLKQNIGFKVVNPKYIEMDGRSKLTMTPDELAELKKDGGSSALKQAVKNPDYNPNKPTYIQFVDKRLASQEQLEDTTNLIKKYDISSTENHYEISNNQDASRHPYFEVDPDDFRFRTKGTTLELLEEVGYIGKDKKRKKGYDSFFEMNNYIITTYGGAGGVNTWDGNVDLFKANISNPSSDPENIKGNKQVKNYYYNLASYWTKLTDDTLTEHIAGSVAKDERAAFANISKQHGIKPYELEDIRDEDIHSFEFNRDFEAKVTGKTTDEIITSAVVDFPLESVEFAPDLTAVLSTEYITPRPLDAYADETLSKTELLSGMPKGVQNMYTGPMTDYMLSVLSSLDKLMPADKKIFKNNNIAELTDYGKAVAGLVSSDVMRYGLTKALFKDTEVEFDKDGRAKYDENLMYKGVSSLNINELTPEDEAYAVMSKMKRGFKRLADSDNKDLVNSLYTRFKDISLDDIKVAKAVINRTGAGLNWRFDAAKDVADLDQRRAQNSHVSFEDCWDDTIDFWGNFISKIRNTNPQSYVIAEVTDLWSFSRWQSASKNSAVAKAIEDFKKMNEASQKRVLTKFFKEEVQSVRNNPQNNDSRQILDALSLEAKAFIEGNTSNMSQAVFNELKGIYIGRNVVVGKNDDGTDRTLDSSNLTIDTASNKDFGKYVNPDTAERVFYEKTGATTGSNYSTFYGLYPELFGQNYENGKTTWRLYNMYSFQNGLEGFFRSAMPQFVNSSHIFVNNHDKPRPFHCVSLDMELFLGDLKNEGDKARARKVTGSENYDKISSMGVAVGEKYLEVFKAGTEAYNKTSGNVKISNEELGIINEAIGNLAAGKFLSAPANMNTSRAFGFLPFDITMKDVMLQARYIAKSRNMEWRLSGNKKPSDRNLTPQEQKLLDKTFEQFSPELDKLSAMFKMMMFSVGVPTLFAGDEAAHSGYETPTKNVELAIRNLVHHEWLNDKDKKFIQDFYKEVTAAAKVHKDKALSALADGFPIIVPQGDNDHTALYKYNDNKSNVLVVYSNKRMKTSGGDEKERARAALNNSVDTIEGISLGYTDPQQDGIMGSVAKRGDVFKKLKYDETLGKYMPTDDIYSVDPKSGKLRKEVKDTSKGGIIRYENVELDDVANIFYKEN